MSFSSASNTNPSESESYCDRVKLLETKRRARKKSIDNRQFLIAISESDFKQVNNLLKNVDINFEDRDGCTPLHWAVETGDVKIIEILLQNGVNLCSKNNALKSPLDIAKQLNRSDIVSILENSLRVTERSKVIEIKQSSESDRKSISSQDQDVAVWIHPVHGFIYQWKVLMLFLHRGLAHKYSFRLGTEIKEAKKFDDLVFEYVQDDKKVYRLLQAKHKFDENKKITVYNLLKETKGDYSLIKYFDSFQACKKDKFFKDGIIKDVIICTNIDFDFHDLKNANIEVTKVQETDNILDNKSDKKESTRYKFKNTMVKQLKSKLRSTITYNEIEDFLNHLVFAVNQPNEEELGIIVKNEIGKEMGFLDSEKIFNKLFIKIINISLGKESSMFLSHEEGKKFFDDLKNEIPIWFNVQEPLSSFIGRLEYLTKTHENLNQNFQVCITGMGGVGKTELVRKYVADYGDKYDNQIIWINAESYSTTVDSFRQLASDKLNIRLISADGKDKHITTVITDVYQVLSKRRSLIIFDNAEKYKCVKEFDCGIDQFLPCLPNKCIKPNIIITSRNQKWPVSIKTIKLEALSVVETRELVEKTLNLENHEQKEMIDELGKRLQFLPLALQQAMAYIKMQKQKLAYIDLNFEISNYLERFSEKTHELLDFKFSEDDDSNYDKTVFTMWNIFLDKLKEKENGQDALDLLNNISYFLPESITVELLLILLTDKDKLSSAIGLLEQYSMVSVQHKVLSVHRLVQQVTRIKLKQQNGEVTVLQSTLKLFDQKNLNFKNVDHIISMWKISSKHIELLEEYSRLSSHIVSELLDCGRYDEATSIGAEVSALLKNFPKNLAALIALKVMKHNLAMCTLQKGQYKKALEELQEVYELQKRILGPSNDQLLITKSNIAKALCQLGRSTEALELYFEVVAAYKRNLKESHPDVLTIKHDLSVILFQCGRQSESFSMMQEVYQMQKTILGDHHEDTLKSRSHIAVFLGYMNKHEESLKILEEVCRNREAILPKNHPQILSTKCNIAGMKGMQEKYNEALKIYQEIYDIQSEQLGENHPDVIDLKVRMAMILRVQSKYDEALTIFYDAFDRQKISLGLMHPRIFQTQNEIGDILVRQKKHAEAIKVFENLLANQMSVLGDSHPDTLQTRRQVLMLLIKLNKHESALEYSLQTVKDVEKMFGKNHPSTFIDKYNLATLYLPMDEFDKALAILTELLEGQEKFLGKNHVDYQKTRDAIANIRLERDNFNQGKSYRRCVLNPEVNSENFLMTKKHSLNTTDERKVEFLLQQGTEKMSMSKEQNTAFQTPADINAKDTEGRTMLYHALSNGNESEVVSLLEHGAEILVTSIKGNTPLHIAVLKGQEKLVNLLLQKLKPERLNEFVDAKTTSSGSTALHVAAKMGHFGIVKCLLKNHATFCITNRDGKMPVDLSNNTNIKNYLKMIHELFEILKHDSTTVLKKLMVLSSEEFLSVANTRNDRGLTLAQVAMLNKQNDVAAQILQMVQKWNVK